MSRRKSIDPSILEAAKQFDSKQFVESVKGEFSDFPDPRRNKMRVLYPVWYLNLVILCGFFCGCNTIEEIAEYALLQREWFSALLGQPYKSPCYGTLWWFLVKTPPEALKQYLQKWFVKLPDQLKNQLLALDGKRLRSANFLDSITHVVELFATEDRLVLAMGKVPDKTVEKSVLPDIFTQVDVSGAIISGDAHFTVATVADTIIDNGADYLLAVKDNQPNLSDELENFFEQARGGNWEGVEHSVFTTIEKEHGRIETREVRVVQDLEWLPQKSKWRNLTSVIEVKSIREWGDRKEKETAIRRYISSRASTATEFAKWVRNHWCIENNCHWVADVIFEEDWAQANRGHCAENLGIFRRIAMNIASNADPERGLASVRRAAAFGPGYLKGILAKIFLAGMSNKFS
jgi:predicted transposase YbfD/YdcC